MSTANPPASDADWARVVLQVLGTHYPHHSGHLTLGPGDTDVTPSRLFPAFHGCLDWHSSVHMQWSLVRLLPALPGELAGQAQELLDERLTSGHIAAEVSYLQRRPGFERPYGWAWAALLAADAPERWAPALAPLGAAVADATLAWLPRLAYPVRNGMHGNTAFALLLMHRAYTRIGRTDVVAAVEEHALRFFAADSGYPLRWEPSGSDFLSPALCEAALMQRVHPAFDQWLPRFLPELADPECPLFDVPLVLDRTDGHVVHLYGLALSRAWLLRTLAAGRDDAAAARWLSAADRLLESALPETTGGDFMATHWLVSFALLAEGAVVRR